MTKTLSPLLVHNILAMNHLTLLSDYRKAKAPIRVICNKGHTWNTTYDTARKTRCAYCTDKAHKTKYDYIKLATAVGFEFIGDIPKRTTDNAYWICKRGHGIEMSFLNIKQGNGCGICGHRTRLTEKNYLVLAHELGIIWLGPLPKNTVAKTNWQCTKGHIFCTSYKSIRHLGKYKGCAICSHGRCGPEHPNWKGGEYRFRYRDRLKRANLIDQTPPDKYLTAEQWKRAKGFFKNSCAYCGKPDRLQRDHFEPVARNGLHSADNILPCCLSCNPSKQDKPPLEWLQKKFGARIGKKKYIELLSVLDYLGKVE